MAFAIEPLQVPPEELSFIRREPRQRLFQAIMGDFKIHYPALKLIYAFLNEDPNSNIDYVLIFKNKTSSGSLIGICPAVIYSDKSIPGYRYFKRTQSEKTYLKYLVDTMSISRENEFYKLLSDGLNLSNDKNNARYWRTCTEPIKLAEFLFDLSLTDTSVNQRALQNVMLKN